MLNSPVDLAIVAGIALLIFGPAKLPALGRSIGQAIRNFKKGMDGDNETDETGTESADARKLVPGKPGQESPSPDP